MFEPIRFVSPQEILPTELADNYNQSYDMNDHFFGVFCRYVMDELGSAVRHSDEPNFRVAPFLFMPEGKLSSAVRFDIYLLALALFLVFHCTLFLLLTLISKV